MEMPFQLLGEVINYKLKSGLFFMRNNCNDYLYKPYAFKLSVLKTDYCLGFVKFSNLILLMEISFCNT